MASRIPLSPALHVLVLPKPMLGGSGEINDALGWDEELLWARLQLRGGELIPRRALGTQLLSASQQDGAR